MVGPLGEEFFCGFPKGIKNKYLEWYEIKGTIYLWFLYKRVAWNLLGKLEGKQREKIMTNMTMR